MWTSYPGLEPLPLRGAESPFESNPLATRQPLVPVVSAKDQVDAGRLKNDVSHQTSAALFHNFVSRPS